MAEAVSGFSREDKATAMRVLSLSGKPPASRSGSAVSTLIRKVSGLHRYRPGRFLGGGDDERGTLGREAALHIPARVRGRHGALAGCFPRCGPWRRRCRPMKDHEKGVGAETWPRSWSRRRLTPRRSMFVGCRLKRQGSERPPHVPRVITRRGHVPRASCGLRVPPLICVRVDRDENGAPQTVELS